MAEPVLTMWEALDPDATRESIAAGGPAIGYGRGVSMTVAEYNATQRSQTSTTTGAKLLTADGLSSASSAPKSKQRASRDEKKAMVQAKVEAREARSESKAAEKAEAEAEARSQDQGAITKCGRCGQGFLGSGWYQNHRNRWCESKQELTRAEQRRRQVAKLLGSMDELQIAQHQARPQTLQQVELTFRADGSSPEPIGIELEITDRGLVVTSVAEGSVAHRTAMVAVGYVVASIDSVLPESPTALSGNVTGTPIRVIFRRPNPQIPLHGSARLTIHKTARYKMLPYQLEWLETNVYSDGQRLSGGVRDKGAYRMMRAAFHNQLRTDTSSVAWLPQEEIAKWLVKQVKATKEARTAARRKEATAERDRVGKPAQPPGKRAKGQHGAKGAKGGKGKARAKRGADGGGSGDRAVTRRRAESDEEDDGSDEFDDEEEELQDAQEEEEDEMEGSDEDTD
jgi:hypothetical protein